MTIGGYRSAESVECSADGVNPRAFSRVRLYPPLAGHVFIVSLLSGLLIRVVSNSWMRRNARWARGLYRWR